MIMKTLIRTFILFFCITGLVSCYAGIPLKSGKSENNQTYEVSYLFEHDGVKVDDYYLYRQYTKPITKRGCLISLFLTISPLSAVQIMTLTGVISFFRGMLDSLFLYLNHSRFIYSSVD